MSADFWAAYLSGALSLIVGSPLDIIKVRQQARALPDATPSYYSFSSAASLLRGVAAPILGYGALNGLLFFSYNRVLEALGDDPENPRGLGNTWVAGAVGGLATFVVSAPTEVVKCRAQLAPAGTDASSWSIAKALYRKHGIRGLYLGGTVTALRDSIGYGFYFYTYTLASSPSFPLPDSPTLRVLLAGGLAGAATWASVYPLDAVKTRVQTQTQTECQAGLLSVPAERRKWHGGFGAWDIAKIAWREGGFGVFWDGIGVCMARAFVVNAVQWAVYEYIMARVRQQQAPPSPSAVVA